MKRISVAQAKHVREYLNVERVVILARCSDLIDHVATHGKTIEHAKEAAIMGNQLKRYLEWPESACNSKPLERLCKNCSFHDAGFQRGGYGYDENNNLCMFGPVVIKRAGSCRACHNFEPNI